MNQRHTLGGLALAALVVSAIGCQLGTGGTQCTQPSDCGKSECITYTCAAGTCGETPKSAGTKVTQQTPGDCNVNQCDGAGNVEVVADDLDLPDDANDCTDDDCPHAAGEAVCP